MYRHLIRPIFFAMQPENAHDVMRAVGRVANVPVVSRALRGLYEVSDPRLAVEVAGIRFANPIGLAAGLDKNAELLGLWNGLGLGHIELGTVTAKPQPGNPKPRIFRLSDDAALINRMGFPSAGADLVEQRMQSIRNQGQALPPLGINIGKSKVAEIDDAVQDYLYSFTKLSPYVEYVTVNVSSPNTPGLRQLQERGRLEALLREIQGANHHKKPLFVKVAPDLPYEALEEVLECCVATGVAGVIATNTTLAREGLRTPTSEAGGLSGVPLFKKSLEMVRFIGTRLKSAQFSNLSLVAVGGISSAADVLAMLAAGAQMVQVYTGLVYQGPGFVKSLNSGLVSFMDRHGCNSLTEAALAWQEGQHSDKAA
jgi:dihydroorotate dehydrogenase